MQADVSGHQRKVVSSRVAPAKISLGDSGIALRNGKTLPFKVSRSWNAPAGRYSESWYLVDPESREVIFEGPAREIAIWGLQSWTEFTDEVTDAIDLEPGTYLFFFALGGVSGGELEIAATEVEAAA